MSVFVSVCCITYNHENYIEKCIKGFLNQEVNFSIEYLIHDDASTDNTQKIIKSLVKNDSRFKCIFRKENLKSTGVSIFPILYQEAKGKYIALCEGDDYWTDPYKLQKQVDFMETHPHFAGCFHDTLLLHDSKQREEMKLWRNYSKEVFNLSDTIATKSLFHTSSFLFKSEYLEIPSWFTKVQSGDMALFTIIAAKGDLGRIPLPMSVYRKNPSSITNAITIKSYHLNRIKLFNFLNEFLDGKEQNKIYNVISFHKKELNKLKSNKLQSILKKIIGG